MTEEKKDVGFEVFVLWILIVIVFGCYIYATYNPAEK